MSRSDEKPWTKEQIDRMYDDAALALRAGDSQAEYHLEAYEVCDLIAGSRAEVAALRVQLDQARLKAFEEIHDNYEFTSTTEEQFDSYLHDEIKRLRALLASNPEGM